MEVKDDVIEIITTYTNPKLTFDLGFIDRGLALRLYMPSYWKRKCTKEARGLLVDERLITAESPLGWYSYYLLKCVTWYGVPCDYDYNTNKVQPMSPQAMPVLASIDAWPGHVFQMPDYKVNISIENDPDTTLEGPGRLIHSQWVSIADRDGITNDRAHLLLLFDTGNLYEFNRQTRSLVEFDANGDVVKFDGRLVLLRSGSVYAIEYRFLSNSLTKKFPTNPLNDVVDFRGTHAVRRNGHQHVLVYRTAGESELHYSDRELSQHDTISGRIVSGFNIVVSMSDIGVHSNVVGYDERALPYRHYVILSDRSLHTLGDKKNNVTIHNVQFAMMNHRSLGGCIAMLLDA